MEVFRFRKFEVRNERSAMKVNTDAVLLGALMTLTPGDCSLLDIGTGTGTIALMAAQRLSDIKSGDCVLKSDAESSLRGIQITGIDIDEDSAREAAENFSHSPWRENLTAGHVSLSDFEMEMGLGIEEAGKGNGIDADDGRFDVIFSNPPYFESSLKAPDGRRRAARHTETMSYREIISFASRHLRGAETRCGRLSLILPFEAETEAERLAASYGLGLFRRVRVRTTPQKPFFRSVIEFRHSDGRLSVSDREITLQNKGGYSDEYRSLVKDFLLI